MQPFPYQIEGGKFLAERKRALLADDMGLGKSAQAILACDELQAKSVVVICPASVVTNWGREIERFRKTEWSICIFSYDKARTYVEAMTKHDRKPAACDVLILDEAHFLKTRDSKRTKAIFGEKCDGVGGLVERAKHVFLLSGTPAPNNASELWPMLRAVMPEAIPAPTGKPMSYWTFVNRYCKTRDNGFGLQIVGGKNLEKLREAMAPWVLRRKKEEVLKDLPPIRFDTLAASVQFADNLLCQAEHEWAAKIRAVLAEKGIAGLKEIAPHVAQLRRLTGLAKVQPVVDWLADWFEGGTGKMVVFAHHRDVMSGILDAFKRAKFHRAAINGGMDTAWRQAQIDHFQNDPDCRLFVGQIQAAGTGITLTAASDALFVESSWVPAENEQAAMRIHRIGQKNACLVRFAALAGSIDEDIQRAVMRKTADISKLFS